MFRKSESKRFQSIFLPIRATVVLASMVLISGFVFVAGAISSEKSSSDTQTDTSQTAKYSFSKYVPTGYSIEGPLCVVSATTSEIKFFSGRTRKPRILDLRGTRVSVKDENNGSLSFSALTAGARVYVCRSQDKKTIIIFVITSTEQEKRNDV